MHRNSICFSLLWHLNSVDGYRSIVRKMCSSQNPIANTLKRTTAIMPQFYFTFQVIRVHSVSLKVSWLRSHTSMEQTRKLSSERDPIVQPNVSQVQVMIYWNLFFKFCWNTTQTNQIFSRSHSIWTICCQRLVNLGAIKNCCFGLCVCQRASHAVSVRLISYSWPTPQTITGAKCRS